MDASYLTPVKVDKEKVARDVAAFLQQPVAVPESAVPLNAGFFGLERMREITVAQRRAQERK